MPTVTEPVCRAPWHFMRVALTAMLLSHFAHSSQIDIDRRSLPQAVDSERKTISVYPVLRPAKHHALAEISSNDISVSDNRHRIDNELLQLSTGTSSHDRPVLFLFDRLDPVHARSARQLAIKALKEIPERTTLAVWAVRERLQLLQDFTPDRTLVTAAIDATAGADRSTDTSRSKNTQTAWKVSMQSVPLAKEIVSRERIPWWAATLEAAAQTWRTVPGRKAIVFFTEEAPAGTAAAEALGRVSQQLRDASVSLYVIDLNAIDEDSMNRADAAMAMGSANSASRQNHAGPPEKMLGAAQQSRMGETMTDLELGNIDMEKPLLRQVASDTYGGYSNAGGNLKRLMRGMVKDLTNYCELTYPIPAGSSPAFHQVEVHSHGAIWKGGYLAHVEGPDLTATGQRKLAPPDTLDKLTRGSTEDTLSVHSDILRSHASLDHANEAIAVKVPIRELELREDQNTHMFTFHASIAMELVDARGQTVLRDEQDFVRHGALDIEERVRSEYLSIERPLMPLSDKYTVRTVLRDWNSGKTGHEIRTVVSTTPRRENGAATHELPLTQSDAGESHDAPDVSDANLAANPPRQSLAGQMLDENAQKVENTLLSADEQASLIEAARSRALAYTERLPNFFCLETLDRSEDAKGKGEWKHRDTILERLLYRDGTEKRTVIKVNGESSHASVESLEGTQSHGEFGGVLRSIFDPEAHTEFRWEREEEENGVLLQVFRYSVALDHSAFYVTVLGEQQVRAAFGGLIYIDSETLAVRKLAAVTRDLPKDFSVRSTWIALRYDYVVVNHHEYLMPARGEVGTFRRKQRVALNELHFSAYRRFGSQVRMVTAVEGAALGHQ